MKWITTYLEEMLTIITKWADKEWREQKIAIFISNHKLAIETRNRGAILKTLRWCYTKLFATTIFNATQRCNIAATLFRIVTTFSNIAKQSCTRNCRWESSRVTSPAELWRAKRACGAPWVSKSTHPRKFVNHVTDRPSDRPSVCTTGIPMFTHTF